jgi:hypothetical protein
MKRFLLFLFVFALSVPGFSTPPKLFPRTGKPDQLAIMGSFGMFGGNFKPLNAYVRQFGTTSEFSPYYRTFGFDLVLPAGGRSGGWNGTINVESVIPQEILVGDSLTFRLKGWHLLTSFMSFDLLKDPKYAFELAPGVDWGHLFFHTINKAGTFRYYNGFIAPLARAEFRVIIYHIAIGARAFYRYDVTSPRWKSSVDSSSGLAHSRMAGAGFQVFIGFGSTYD